MQKKIKNSIHSQSHKHEKGGQTDTYNNPLDHQTSPQSSIGQEDAKPIPQIAVPEEPASIIDANSNQNRNDLETSVLSATQGAQHRQKYNRGELKAAADCLAPGLKEDNTLANAITPVNTRVSGVQASPEIAAVTAIPPKLVEERMEKLMNDDAGGDGRREWGSS